MRRQRLREDQLLTGQSAAPGLSALQAHVFPFLVAGEIVLMLFVALTLTLWVFFLETFPSNVSF